MSGPVKLFELPLGSWFRYRGGSRVYVLLDRADIGLVAHANVENHSAWPGQGIFSAADSAAELREMLVEPVPVKEIS